MRTFAAAYRVCKGVSPFPRMSALGTMDYTLCRSSSEVLETMAVGVCLLRFGYCRQSSAQSCDFFLYACSRFHNQKLNRLGCTCVSCLTAGLLWRSCILRSSAF